MIRRLALLIVVAMLTVACPVQQIAQVEIAPVEVAAGEPSPGPTDEAASPEPVEEPSPVSEPSPGESDDPADADVLSDGETQTPPPTEPPPPPPSPDPANRPPLASDVRVSTEEDKAILVDAAANDVDPDGDPLFVSLESPPRNGKLAVSGDVLSYTPNANYHGSDSFTYRVSDGKGGSDVGTVAITITPVNDRPDARDDMLSVSEDTSGQVNVLANDVDVDGDALTAKLVSGPANGKVTQSGGTFTYTPNGNYIGDDSFTYDAVDPSGATDRATVNITVGGVNDPPVAANHSLTVDEDGSGSVTVDVSDPDGDSLTVAIASGPKSGSAAVSVRDISYTPNANFNGQDALTYEVSDGKGGTATGTVTITVRPVPDAPVANNDGPVLLQSCTASTFPVLGNDSDPDEEPLRVVAVGNPKLGSLTILKDNSIRWQPDPDYPSGGTDAVGYRVEDPTGRTAEARILLDVNGCPRAFSDSFNIWSGTSVVSFDPVAGTAPQVPKGEAAPYSVKMAADSDPNGDSFSMTGYSVPRGSPGTLTRGRGNVLNYTPSGCGYTLVITYTITDSRGGSDKATVSIGVTCPVP